MAATESIDVLRKEIAAVMDRARALLMTARAPIKPFTYHDEVTGQEISLEESALYTILRVGDRSFYFIRETGGLDGTDLEHRTPLWRRKEEYGCFCGWTEPTGSVHSS